MDTLDFDYSGNLATQLCGVRYPIFLAGMAAISGPKLVAAVANAGGMGIVGGLRLPPLTLRKWIRETRSLTDKPFGVNLVPQFGGPEVFEAQFQVILQEKPRMLSLFYAEDYSADMIPRAKDAGLVVMVQTGTAELARTAIAQGADIIVAQGSEGGGHLNRGTIGLMALLPSIIDCSKGRPVLAAGAITNRHDVKAAMCLGASGVLVGTAFVASEESNAHPIYKQKIVEATTDDVEYRTGYSFGWTYGTPHRVIPNRDKWNLLRFVGGGARDRQAEDGSQIVVVCRPGGWENPQRCIGGRKNSRAYPGAARALITFAVRRQVCNLRAATRSKRRAGRVGSRDTLN